MNVLWTVSKDLQEDNSSLFFRPLIIVGIIHLFRKHKNAGAVLIIKTNLEIIPKLIYPSGMNQQNWIEDEDSLKKRPPTPPRWKNN
jgi:hypothetical protein